MRFSLLSVHDHYPNEQRTVREHYRETIENIVLAEELGFESFWVAEHHFHEYGTIPNPAVFLSAASQNTDKIGLGVAISVLPFRNPLHVAEDYLMLDNLSGGRLLLGVGSGYLRHEFAGFGLDQNKKRDHFDENLVILKKALSGAKISFEGTYNSIDSVGINVPPTNSGGIPIYIAALKKEVAYYIGNKGHSMLSIPYATVDSLDELRSVVAEYKRGWKERKTDFPPPPINFAFHAYVAETDAAARAGGEGPFDYYVKTRLYGKSSGWEEVCKRGYCVFGGIETCISRLNQMKAIGIEHVSLLMDFGYMGKEKTQQSMRLMAEQIIPNLD
ncbi:MAG: LLM class flavin-dependent oxidoreductase [Pseudomonadota bacterium]|nr:LLM class flavin-dependent oxidoreductase [Pseudomonadota bacterium]